MALFSTSDLIFLNKWRDCEVQDIHYDQALSIHDDGNISKLISLPVLKSIEQNAKRCEWTLGFTFKTWKLHSDGSKGEKPQKEPHSGGQNEGLQSVEKAAQKESITLLQMVLLVEKEHFLGIHQIFHILQLSPVRSMYSVLTIFSQKPSN